MSHGSRLAAILAGAAAGSAIALISSASTWTRVVESPRRIGTGLGTINLGGAAHSYTAADLGSPVLPIALLCLVFALSAFLVGPRMRTVLTGLLFIGSMALLLFAATVPGPPAHVVGLGSSGPGRIPTYVGAVVALGGAAAAFPLVAQVERLRIPESGPDEPNGE